MSNDLLRPKAEAPCLALRPREAAKALGVSERTCGTGPGKGSSPTFDAARGSCIRRRH